MAARHGQAHRDLAIFTAWVHGAHQDELAAQYKLTQQAISSAVDRTVAALPPADVQTEVFRTLRLIDELLVAYVPAALAGKPAFNREVRGLLALKGRYLGVDRRKVEHEITGDIAHHWEPGPTVAEVLEEWRQQGFIRPRVELTRTDQGGES